MYIHNSMYVHCTYLAVPMPNILVRAPPTTSATTSLATSNIMSPTDLNNYSLISMLSFYVGFSRKFILDSTI